MALVLATAPSEEPVTLQEAKSHLRVDAADDDALITSLITAARETVEHITRRALVTQTWDYFLDAFPSGDELALPLPPLRAVTSITYKDKDGNVSTFDASNYVVDTASEPGRVVLKSSATWPSATLWPASAVTVQFDAGYGGAADVPQAIKQGLLLLVGHLYENREAIVPGTVLREIPMGVDALLWPYRVLRWL